MSDALTTTVRVDVDGLREVRAATATAEMVRAYIARAEVAACSASVLAEPAALLSFDEDGDLSAELGDDGVATIHVRGALTQRATCLSRGYDEIERVFCETLADDRVRGVLLALDSPGGDVAGLFDACDRMRAAVVASGKPVTATACDGAYSAAYALACVADEIVVPRTGGVGSVGVISTIASQSRALAEAGVDVAVVRSGAEKADGHPALPLDAATIARTQDRVDTLAAMFVRMVAERRGMTQTAVRALEAGVRYGAAAVKAGLADRVDSLPNARASVVASIAKRDAMAASANTEPANMTDAERSLLESVYALTGETTAEGAAGALAALAGLRERVATLEADLAASRATIAEAAKAAAQRDRAEALAVRRANGRLAPSVERAEGFAAMVESMSADGFAAYLRGLDAMPTRTERSAPAAREDVDAVVSAREVELGAMFGQTPEALAEARKFLAAQAARRNATAATE